MLKDFEMLGFEGEDLVTGFKGVVTCISYDLYGCVQAIIVPKVNKDSKAEDGRWFDTKRIKITSNKPVMAIPYFASDATVIGCEIKPEGR